MNPRTKRPSRTWSLVLTLGVPLTIVGVSAMAISYATLIDVARVNGLPLPELFPILIDVGTVACMIAAAQMRLRGINGRWVAYLIFIALSIVSIVANATHAWRAADLVLTTTWAAAILASVPPATLLAITHLVMMLVPDEKERARLQALREKLETTKPATATLASTPQLAQQELQPKNTATGSEQTKEPLRLVAAPTSDSVNRRDVADKVLDHFSRVGEKPTGSLVGEWLGGKSAKTGQRFLKTLEDQGAFLSAGREQPLTGTE
ncbi:MAG: hypothetical protein ACTIKL_07880 [Canibacter sp.]